MVHFDRKIRPGFTLAELLIVLGILGFIAVLTVRNLVLTSQEAASNARAQEVAEMIASAFDAYQRSNDVTSSTSPSDLTPYMNYVSTDVSTTIDRPGLWAGYDTCSSPTYPCIKLHNGGILLMDNACAMAGNSSLNFMQFRFDPDGVAKGPSGAYGPSRAIWFEIYADGTLRTRDTLKPNSVCSSGTWGPASTNDSTWFTWN